MINIVSLALVLALFNVQNASVLWAFSGANDSEPATQTPLLQPLPIPESKTFSTKEDIEPDQNLVMNSLTITGYSSEYRQTDSDPFITASGKTVRSGIVAANFLPFGTKIKIPEIFGDRVFTVEDHMAKKHSDKVDIWFPSSGEARQFGVKTADIVILN